MMDFKIPKQFQLMGRTISVVLEKDLSGKTNNTGEARRREDIIALQRQGDGYPMPTDQLNDCFFHELIHFIFDAAGTPKTKNPDHDEEFVERVGCLLHQAIKTMK